MSETIPIPSSQETELSCDGKADAGQANIQNIGAKRRRIDSANQDNTHDPHPPPSQRYPHLSRRPQSTPPSTRTTVLTPSRMITRSLSKSQSQSELLASGLDRGQTASPSNSIVSESLRQVSSTSTILPSRAFTQSPTLTVRHPIPQNQLVRRVFSQPAFQTYTPITPSSSSYRPTHPHPHPQQTGYNHTFHPATPQLHQAHQTIQSLQNQLTTSSTAIRALESRVINSESLLSSKSVELDQARNELQSLRFQLHQQGLNGVSQSQLNDERSRHSGELEEMRVILGEVVRKVSKEREEVDRVQREMKAEVDRLKEDVKEREREIEEIGGKNLELVNDGESRKRDLRQKEDRIMDLQATNTSLSNQIDSLAEDLLGRDEILSSLKTENEHHKERLNNLQKEVTLLNASKESLGKILNTYQKNNEEMQEELKQEKQRSEEIRKVGWEQLNALRRECDVLQARNAELEKEQKGFEDSRLTWKRDEKSKRDLRDSIGVLEGDLQSAKETNVELNEEKDRSSREINQGHRKLAEVREELGDIQTKNGKLENALIELRGLNGDVQSELKSVKSERSILVNQIKQSKENNLKSKKERKALKVQIQKLESNVKSLKKEKERLEKVREDSDHELEALDGVLVDLRKANEELKAEKQLLAQACQYSTDTLELLKDDNTLLLSQLEISLDKSAQLERFVQRIKSAHDRYGAKFAKHANNDKPLPNVSEVERIIRNVASIQSESRSTSPKERRRRDKLIRVELKRSKIPYRLEWLEYWIRLIGFALDDLGDVASVPIVMPSHDAEHDQYV